MVDLLARLLLSIIVVLMFICSNVIFFKDRQIGNKSQYIYLISGVFYLIALIFLVISFFYWRLRGLWRNSQFSTGRRLLKISQSRFVIMSNLTVKFFKSLCILPLAFSPVSVIIIIVKGNRKEFPIESSKM